MSNYCVFLDSEEKDQEILIRKYTGSSIKNVSTLYTDQPCT